MANDKTGREVKEEIEATPTGFAVKGNKRKYRRKEQVG